MKQWQESDLKHLMDSNYFPNCIECSEHYLDFKHRSFFHKEGCQRGINDWGRTNERLNERLKAFEERHGVRGSSIKCEECENPATGKIHVLYHNTQSTVESWPVCMDHAWHEDSAGRESQYRGM